MFLLASTIGILQGLYVDFYLCIALCFCMLIIGIIFKSNFSKLLMFICCILVFYVYTAVQINMYDTKYKDGTIEDNFKIVSYKEVMDYYDKYIAKNSNGDKFLIYLPHSDKELKKGTVIYCVGEFSLPDLERNTGGFNYRRYLNSQKIFGSVYIDKYYISDLSEFNLIYWVQDEIYSSLARLFPKNEMGLILGMMIGETKDISENVLENFKNTGITHLVAVSGSNVAYVIILVQFVFQKLIGKRGTYFVSIFFIIIFMLVSGASSSVIRASIMSILSIVASITYFKSDIVSNICFSAFILMIISPLIVFDVGFILSFGGTIGIVALSKDFERVFSKFGKLSQTLAVTCSAQVILTPIMMYYFNTISILSIITNLIVAPISGSITILGFVVFLVSKFCLPLAKLFANSLYILSTFTISTAKIFSSIPFSSFQTITPNLFEILFFYFLIFYLVGKIDLLLFGEKIVKLLHGFKLQNYSCVRKIISLFDKCNAERKFKFISCKNKASYKFIFVLLSIFVCIECTWYFIPRNYLDVRCVDVGQGDCIFIETNNRKKILIDGGGSETYDVGKNILLPYLLDRRVMCIDTIISSHADADHLYGLITVLENVKVNRIIIAKNSLGYKKVYEIAEKKKIDVIEVLKGDILTLGDIRLEAISPSKNMDNSDVNDYSLVVKLMYGEKSILFTGDISQNIEKTLYSVDADILKVAHHGSNSSSEEGFIKRVNPSLAIIGVGKENKYGHPADEVMKRLKNTSKVYTTAEYGEIKLKIYKNRIKYVDK